VWSDALEDIDLASCEVVGVQDEGSLKRPVWGPDFTVVSHEILIGKKTDAACFQAFPSNDSRNEMCYKPQEVVIFSEMRHMKALILTANQQQYIFGNVSSTIYHQEGNMWIANTLLGSISQTICTIVREGGDLTKPAVNAVQYNWTDRLFYVATEIIDVEYGVGEQVLDHWAFGPHHAWTDPSTGIIVRMWQPFNGLQVFEPGTWEEGVAIERSGGLFDDLAPNGLKAPPQALPSGSFARINCGDDGFNNNYDRSPVMASRICIMNYAAFAIDYIEAENTRSQQWIGNGDNYAVYGQRCMDLATVAGGSQSGDIFEARVQALVGARMGLDRPVVYTEGWVAEFACRGTTLSFACSLIQNRPDEFAANHHCGEVVEDDVLSLRCETGVISEVSFASYGTPTGSCMVGSLATDWCHADNSQEIVEQKCLGYASCSISASNGVFGDPCARTTKSLVVRVKCDGVSQTNATEVASRPLGHALADMRDLRRARAKVPRSEYRGDNFGNMSKTLNQWLLKHAPRSLNCEQWTVHELQELQMRLLLLRDPQLDEVYHQAQDSRQIRKDLGKISEEWEELNELAKSDMQLARAHRDGHCHEAVMWYVHHIPESLKLQLKDDIALPLLSGRRHVIEPSVDDQASQRVHQAYDYKVTCGDCHAPVFPASVVV